MALGLYLATMAPGLTWAHDAADGGELAAAAWTLGIPHPPGHPTYVLLAHLFTRLPLGGVATRTNLFSALCAAATVALVTYVLPRSGRRWVAAVAAGLALASAPLLWSQATVTEVHTLNGLFTAVLLALSVLRAPQQSLCQAVAVGWVWGLGLGNHPTLLLCGPLVARALGRSGKRWAAGAAGLVLGLGIYLYLPLRATASPPINWGDPRTLDRLWWVVSGDPYRRYLFALPVAYLPQRLAAWLRLLGGQFGLVGTGVTAWGAAALWSEDRPLLVATGATAALVSAFALGYDTTDSYLYLIPAVVCAALWLGTGIDALLGAVAHRSQKAALALGALAVAFALPGAALRWPMMDLSGDRTAEEFGRTVLAQAPPEAVVVTRADGHTFALWYLQQTEGLRPDVTVVDADLVGQPWYNADLDQRLGASAAVLAALAAGEPEQGWVADQLGRPVCHIDGTDARMDCTRPGG